MMDQGSARVFVGLLALLLAGAIVRSLIIGKAETFYEDMSPSRRDSPRTYWMFILGETGVLVFLGWLLLR